MWRESGPVIRRRDQHGSSTLARSPSRSGTHACRCRRAGPARSTSPQHPRHQATLLAQQPATPSCGRVRVGDRVIGLEPRARRRGTKSRRASEPRRGRRRSRRARARAGRSRGSCPRTRSPGSRRCAPSLPCGAVPGGGLRHAGSLVPARWSATRSRISERARRAVRAAARAPPRRRSTGARGPRSSSARRRPTGCAARARAAGRSVGSLRTSLAGVAPLRPSSARRSRARRASASGGTSCDGLVGRARSSSPPASEATSDHRAAPPAPRPRSGRSVTWAPQQAAEPPHVRGPPGAAGGARGRRSRSRSGTPSSR